jgi:serine/threonine protein kinase
LDQIGKYRIVAKIGQGATSFVYKGYDATLDRHVAIKVIAAEASGDETLRKRFAREAQSAALLNHPNIITVYDFGQEQDKLYMAMELLEGVDLKGALADHRLETLDDQLEVMEQICDGLAAAHANGVVHRDLKPANIHLLPNGQVKIMDFGLARLVGSDMTRTGLVMGTPHYMSPEQVRGEHVDARSDVFSLGAVFYEILAGKKPFDGDTLHSVLYKVMQAEPVPLKNNAPHLAPVLLQVVEKAMARAAGDRFQDAGEFRRFLGEAREAMASGRGAEPLAGLVALSASRPVPAPVPARAAPSAPAPHPAPVAREGSASPHGAAAASSHGVPRRSERPGERSSGPRSRSTSLAPRPPSRLRYVLALAILIVFAVAAALWARRGQAPEGGAPSRPPSAQLDSLTRTLVETQVELARKKLAAGDYEEAEHQADTALKLDPNSAAARQVLDRARKIKEEIERSAAEARAGVAGRDAAKAASALWKLLQVAPDHPAAVELATALDPDFKPQADEARRLMGETQRAAEKAQVNWTDSFKEGLELARSGEAAQRARAYASAARDFMRAKGRFQKALR